MTDLFEGYNPGLESPPTQAETVVPSDANDLAFTSRAINVAETGTVAVTTLSGDVVTLYIAAGVAFPIRATRIWSTGTTATGIISLC